MGMNKPRQDAFQLSKEALEENSLLVHYDSARPLILACDASQYGIGAVLSHGNGEECPIHTHLGPSMQQKSGTLSCVALAIMFGEKYFIITFMEDTLPSSQTISHSLSYSMRNEEFLSMLLLVFRGGP